MDPDATFQQYQTADSPHEVAAYASSLIGWIANGGFVPTHPNWDARRTPVELRAVVAYAAWLANGAVDGDLIHLLLTDVHLFVEHDNDGFHVELVGYDRTGGRTWEEQFGPVDTFREAFTLGYDRYDQIEGVML